MHSVLTSDSPPPVPIRPEIIVGPQVEARNPIIIETNEPAKSQFQHQQLSFPENTIKVETLNPQEPTVESPQPLLETKLDNGYIWDEEINRRINPKFDKFAIALKSGQNLVSKRIPIQVLTFLSKVRNFIIISDAPGSVGDIVVDDVYTHLYGKRLVRRETGLERRQNTCQNMNVSQFLTDTSTIYCNADNCGTCGNVCQTFPNSISVCSGGSCGLKCLPGFDSCDGQLFSGCEVNLLSNFDNCGVCGNACPTNYLNAYSTCLQGICGYKCFAEFSDCDGNTVNGCESLALNCKVSGVHIVEKLKMLQASSKNFMDMLGDEHMNLNIFDDGSVSGFRTAQGNGNDGGFHNPRKLQKRGNDRVAVVPNTEAKGWKSDAHKNLPGLKKLYEKYPSADWYMMIDDDTYLLMHNIHNFLSHLDPDEDYYIGNPNVFVGCDGVSDMSTTKSNFRQGSDIRTRWFRYNNFKISNEEVDSICR